MTKFRVFSFAVIALVFWTELIFFATAEELRPLIVVFTVQSSFDRPVIEGTTNLPDGTKLIVSLKTPAPCRPDCQYMQSESTVKNGRFIAGQFESQFGLEHIFSSYDPGLVRDGGMVRFQDHRLVPGTYTLEITTPMAELEPDEVRAIIGPQGENLKGPHVKWLVPNGGYKHLSEIDPGQIHAAVGPLVHYITRIAILPKH